MNDTRQLSDILTHIQSNSTCFIFGYTSMCGTCQMAERMLNIALDVRDVPIIKVNLNYVPQWTQSKEIQSVPILMRFENGEYVEFMTKMEGVVNIVNFLSK
ncbi:thioredoxin [Abyssicoccus albus]|uniref:Thioredoxin n=2 Tax=Abyssicoccus albus TaxID=1817405 RepID=A0A3N5BI93_9BACL|nr:thioredoxin [Abyssicoccus albus]